MPSLPQSKGESVEILVQRSPSFAAPADDASNASEHNDDDDHHMQSQVTLYIS